MQVSFGGNIMRYKFRYFNGLYKTIAKFGIPLHNFMLLFIILFVIIIAIRELAALVGLDGYITNQTVVYTYIRIMFICSSIWGLVNLFGKKGVFLYNDRLVIARYTVTLTNWKNRITINYNDIASVNVNYTDISFTKYRFALVVLLGDKSYNVEVTMKNGKKYFFSIENQEEFCENLNLMIENYRKISQ